MLRQRHPVKTDRDREGMDPGQAETTEVFQRGRKVLESTSSVNSGAKAPVTGLRLETAWVAHPHLVGLQRRPKSWVSRAFLRRSD